MEVGDAKATVCRSRERRDRIGRVASGAKGDPAQHVAVFVSVETGDLKGERRRTEPKDQKEWRRGTERI